MTPNKKIIIVFFVAGIVFMAFYGISLRHAAVEHVRFYTGTEPSGINCIECHVTGYGGTLKDRLTRPRYRSPLDLAISSDGRKLYATGSQGNSLLIVDLETQRLSKEVPVGSKPNSVVLSPDGQKAYVSNEGDDSISVVDLNREKVIETIPVGDAPTGMALAQNGATLFVSNWFENSVSVVDLAQGIEIRRLTAGSNPYDIASTPDGKHLLIANQLSFVRNYPDPPVSEVTILDMEEQRVVNRLNVINAHLLEGISVAPQGDLALVTLVRPKNLLPAIQVSHGWMMTNGLGIINLQNGLTAQVLLDEPGAFYADPADIVFTPDGNLAFVSHAGVDIVSVIDVEKLKMLLNQSPPAEIPALANRLGLSQTFIRARIPTAANPKGLAVSPDGAFVFVAERLADQISVIDVNALKVLSSIAVGKTHQETVLRRGERLFNSAAHTFEHQFSCRSCHPNNHVDKLQYDFEPDGLGRNIVDNRSLLEIQGTDPFKWNGKNTSMYMQCGIRFAKFLTRVEPFSPKDLNALVAFMRSLQNSPNRHRLANDSLTPMQARGKAIFERSAMNDGTSIHPKDRCTFCHTPPKFTNQQKFDVGSRASTDDIDVFDTPQLLNIYQSPPYLHDGRAHTLEEIWTRFNPNDTHGITRDLTKGDLNDLIAYLKSL